MENDVDNLAALREERIKLEREALELEKARFEAAKLRSSDAAAVAMPRHSPLGAILFAMVAFLLGVLVGAVYMELRQQQSKSARLREALAQLQNVDIGAIQAQLSTTNQPAANAGKGSPVGAHRNVSVIVVE